MSSNKRNELVSRFWNGDFDNMTIAEVKINYPEYFENTVKRKKMTIEIEYNEISDSEFTFGKLEDLIITYYASEREFIIKQIL